MKKTGILIIAIIFALITSTTGCKTDEGFDITNGSWGFFLTSSVGGQMSMVYAFRGGKNSGDVVFSGIIVGTYGISRNSVIIHTEHNASTGETYIYDFNGTIESNAKFTGTFTLQFPDNPNVTGTFEATR